MHYYGYKSKTTCQQKGFYLIMCLPTLKMSYCGGVLAASSQFDWIRETKDLLTHPPFKFHLIHCVNA